MSKRIVILGGGESGVGAALLAVQKGYDVFLSDSRAIPFIYRDQLQIAGINYEETHNLENILNASIIIKSPGIPSDSEIVKKIKQANIKIISEIEFAWLHKGDSKVIAITGSNGKSTTTAMTYHIFRTAGYNCAMVGNIGYSFCKQIAENPVDYYVVEVSSFQLDEIDKFQPDVAIITNITEDHLDRYDYKYENYIKSKFRIIKNQDNKDYFIYSLDDTTTIEYLPIYLNQTNPIPFTMKKPLPEGAYIADAKMHLKWKEEEIKMSVEDFAIKGKHNQYNTMAAALSATVMGIRKEKIRDAVQTFESLEHRMESVATVKGVEFINDSKATNINSLWFALESMTKPTVLIIGGIDKGNDYSLISELVAEKVKAVICLGVDNKKIIEAFETKVPIIIETTGMIEAVQSSFMAAAKGDVVLLSPACASFDLFKNYEDRGTQFKIAVKEL